MFGVFKTLGHYTEYFNLDQNDLKRTYAKICCFTPISLLVQGKYFHLHHIHSEEKIKWTFQLHHIHFEYYQVCFRENPVKTNFYEKLWP